MMKIKDDDWECMFLVVLGFMKILYGEIDIFCWLWECEGYFDD